MYRLCGALQAGRTGGPGRPGASKGTVPAEALSAVFVVNESATCALRHQRAAPPGELVVWDYHVLVRVDSPVLGRWILDLDSRLGFAVPEDEYVAATVDRRVPERFRPGFRVVPADVFLARFSTDRRHMRDAEGGWLHPPPWDLPRGAGAATAHELPRFLDVGDSTFGPVRSGLV